MRILADFHHEHLYESLRILFEDRFGWELFRPIGEEWYNEGYWKVYDHPSTVQQYLSLNGGRRHQDVTEDGRQVNGEEHRRYQNWNPTLIQEGVYEVETPSFPGQVYKAITLEAFKENDFDVILASMPAHQGCYVNLRNNFKPNAKLIFQAGNNWPAPGGYQNLLTSTTTMRPAPGLNYVEYHQEFSLDVFSPCNSTNSKSIANLMHYCQNWGMLGNIERDLGPDWSIKSYGAGNRDNPRGPNIQDIADAFEEMGFLWHWKQEGDGYGYNIHHAAARGRPLLVNKAHFAGMTADPLLIDGQTCIDLGPKTHPEILNAIRDAEANYPQWQENVIKRFNEVVNFDEEFEKIKLFMENLI